MELEMTDSKIDQAVFKIFRMTHEGRLDWDHTPAPRLWQQNSDSVFPNYFEALHQGRKLALFQRRERLGAEAKQMANLFGEPANEWGGSVHLALLGKNDELLYEFPWSRQVQDLFDAVRYKEANVDEFLDELLKSEPASEKE
jgi:hypothetical protein